MSKMAEYETKIEEKFPELPNRYQVVSLPRRFPPSRFASIFTLGRFAPNTLVVSPPIQFPPKSFPPQVVSPTILVTSYMHACMHVHVLYSEKIQFN